LTTAGYSPGERTALVLVGTGTAGAYHAGVLRALLEAGVRLDVVAGRGMGAASALFAAVDAAPRLWDLAGGWPARPGPRRLYGWRPAWRVMGGGLIVAACLLALPLAALAALAVAYPLLLPIQLLWPDVGAAAIERWREIAALVSGPVVVGLLVPRLVTVVLLVIVATALGLYGAARWRDGRPRDGQGALWWRALGSPFDSQRALVWVTRGFWAYLRGAASISQPDHTDLSRRYAELLSENLGTPGYRELVVLAHDLESRRDVVFALLAEPHRKRLIARIAAGAGAEVIDLAGAGRVHVIDAIAAALTPPLVCEPHAVTFAPEGFWRGETHRMCDRPSAVLRLLREVEEAGATQVIVVSATPPMPAPHALRRPGASPRERLGEAVESIESAALDDALSAAQGRFRALFEVRLEHNPVGPFDFAGNADRRSDRHVALGELVQRGYEDAYRQLLDPVIGASGEQIHGATVVGPTPMPPDFPLKPS
jgi:hypothetical protein